MPSNQSPLGALPRRFRRQRILIVGCGDVGMRVARDMPQSLRKIALTHSPERMPALQAAGVQPILGNLDDAVSLQRLAGVAHRIVYLAAPPADAAQSWWLDPRAKHFSLAVRRRSAPAQLVYASTTGVYGDCQGARVDESHPSAARTPRAQRRVDAEEHMRGLSRCGISSCILRIPGIYAHGREGGTPRARLEKRTPVLVPHDDVYTNHIHADDLARACIAAVWRGQPARIYNICDDTELKMGDYFDLAADLYGLERPPRISRDAAQKQLPPMLLSFMSESRRIVNQRMKRELRVVLCHPTVKEGLLSGAERG